MDKPRPIYKRWYFWVAIVIWFIVLANLGKKNNTPAQVIAPEPTQEVQEETPLSYFTEATGIKEASIKFQDDYVEIIYTMDGTLYDYTDYVSKGLTDFVKTGKLIYANTDCNSFRMDMQVDGSAVTSLIITRDNFESIDWSSLAYTEGIYDQIQDKFDKFYVESMLMKDVDTSKIMYKGK